MTANVVDPLALDDATASASTVTASTVTTATAATVTTTATTRPHRLTVIDGGTGREIHRRGGPFRQPEWSALALYSDPAIVTEVHRAFLDAGAQALTTNTYAVVPFHLGMEAYKADGKRLLALAVDLCIEARGDRDDVAILGSIPPICGSYQPDSFDASVAGPVIDDFLNAYCNKVDVLLLETIGSVKEADFYLRKIKETEGKPLPVWLSFCLEIEPGYHQHPRLLSGDSLTSAVQALSESGHLDLDNRIEAILVNCCDIRVVALALEELRVALAATNKQHVIRTGAYPNAFSVPPPGAANHTLRHFDSNITPDRLKTRAVEWMALGADIVGGCCGVGPEHIEALAKLRHNDDCNDDARAEKKELSSSA